MFAYVIGGSVGAVVGAVLVWLLLYHKFRLQSATAITEEKANLALERAEIIRQAESTAKREQDERERSLRQALQADRDELVGERQRLDQRRQKLDHEESNLEKRELALGERDEALDQRLSNIEKRSARVTEAEEQAERRLAEIDQQRRSLTRESELMQRRLAQVAEMSVEEATTELFRRLDGQLAEEQARHIQRYERETRERRKELALEVIGNAVQRYAAEHTAEITTARVPLTDEDMKGRIIGREGRNIRAFEQASGVNLIVDDTPGQITISCFDGLRREIARRALLKLMEDGRIQPARIEDVLDQTRQEMDRITLKLGEDATYECDVSGVHPQLLRMLGKLHYRMSYGQNVLQHAREVSVIAGHLARELGVDVKTAQRCGLLHDIGKALDHDREGSHPDLGAAALAELGEKETVVDAARHHHEDPGRGGSIYSTLVAAADAISAARPGARHENAERFIQRLGQLEDIACSYPGVTKAYAIQAGHELRVFIDAHAVSDSALPKLAHDIARQIEAEVAYPGDVKVNLIREIRQVVYAH